MCCGASALEVYTCTWASVMAHFYVNLPQIKVSLSESFACGSALTDVGSSTQSMGRIFWWQPRWKRCDRSDYLSYALVTFPLTHAAFPLGVAIASFTDVRTHTAELPSFLRPALQKFFHHHIGTAEVSTLMDTTTMLSASQSKTVIVGFLPLLRHPLLKLGNYITPDPLPLWWKAFAVIILTLYIYIYHTIYVHIHIWYIYDIYHTIYV